MQNLLGESHQRLPLVTGNLAEEQVERLDSGGALIQRVDLDVADVLLQWVGLGEA